MNEQPNSLMELKSIADNFFTTAEAFIKHQKERNAPSDQHLLDDGWIRHTGDVCPVHELDEGQVIFESSGNTSVFKMLLASHDWRRCAAPYRITHYKVTKKYDPHAESKALYAKDALFLKEPWKLWEFRGAVRGVLSSWMQQTGAPAWVDDHQYRRKQTKKLIDWSCHLLKGANTNYGELLRKGLYSSWLYQNGVDWGFKDYQELRLATPANDHANWQPFFSTPENDEKLRSLAKMVKVRVRFVDVSGELSLGAFEQMNWALERVCNYRITGLQEGWTDNKEDV